MEGFKEVFGVGSCLRFSSVQLLQVRLEVINI